MLAIVGSTLVTASVFGGDREDATETETEMEEEREEGKRELEITINLP